MSHSVDASRQIELNAESKVSDWRRTRSGGSALKEELLQLISDKTFHSAKLMRLYAEVLLTRGELEEGTAAFDTYMSLQVLSLMKQQSGARSLPDSVEEGTVSIVTLMLKVLEDMGTANHARIFKVEEQLQEVLNGYHDKDVPIVVSAVAPIFARITLKRLLLAEDDEAFQKLASDADSWFFKVDFSQADTDTLYANALFLALTRGPNEAFNAAKVAVEKHADHPQSVLLLMQTLSSKQELDAALAIGNAYLARKPSPKTIREKLAIIRIKKTQIALLEVLRGSETALGELEEFIECVNRFFPSKQKNGQQNGHAATTANHVSPKPARRIFSFKRRTTNESFASNITPHTTPSHSQHDLLQSDPNTVAFSWFWIAQQYVKVGLETEARQALEEGETYLLSDNDLIGASSIQAVHGQIAHAKDPSRALQNYLKALELSPLNIAAAVGAALLLTAENSNLFNEELAETISCTLDSISKRSPGRFIPEVWYARGLLYEKLGVDSVARTMYWKAIELEERRGVTDYVGSNDMMRA